MLNERFVRIRPDPNLARWVDPAQVRGKLPVGHVGHVSQYDWGRRVVIWVVAKCITRGKIPPAESGIAHHHHTTVHAYSRTRWHGRAQPRQYFCVPEAIRTTHVRDVFTVACIRLDMDIYTARPHKCATDTGNA